MRLIQFFGSILFVVAGMFSSEAARAKVVSPKAADNAPVKRVDSRWPLPLRVVGTQIVNGENHLVTLRGVNVASLEWTNHGEGPILRSLNVAIRDWHVNIIRLPLAQDRWFGHGGEQRDGGASYRALVDAAVNTCATQNCYIILDLHWSDCGQWGTNIGQHCMPDTNSVTFWKGVAARFRNHPAVLFGLYNEPHDVSWDVWLKGGEITERRGWRGGPPRTYQAVGMQTLLDTVRRTGAKNVAIAGGLDWAYDFSGILEGRELQDPKGNGVLYDNHTYNMKGDTAWAWIAKMEKAADKLPVFIGEFGGSGGPNRRTWGRRPSRPDPSGDDWLLHVMQAIVDHKWSYTAWDFHPTAGPTLIADWTYKPTPDFGVYVKQMLVGEYPRYTPPPPVPAPPPGSETNSPAATPTAATPASGADTNAPAAPAAVAPTNAP